MRKMKRICSLIISAALIVSGIAIMPSQIKAANIVSGNYEYTLKDDGTVELVKYNGSEKTITIPTTLDSKKVTSIHYDTFENNTTLQTVTIPEGIQKMDFSSFSNCSALTTVNFNATNCAGSVDPVFKKCSNLKNINIGSKVTTIGSYLFKNTPITSITIPSSVKEIGYYAFSGTSLKSVTIPESLEKISFCVFKNCKSLETVNFNAVNCGGSVDPVFDGCDNLKTVNIGSKVTTIGSYLFKNTPITSITIPSSVKEIGYYAFSGTSLKSVTIPESLEKISFCVFKNCKSLETVNFNAVNCGGSVDPVFDGCDNLKTVNIGSKVTKIGSSLFQNTPITSIVVPSKVTEIGYNAFKGTKIKTVSLPEGLKNISFGVFQNCDNLTDVYYAGSKETWTKIKVGSDNEKLTKAKIHFGKIIVSPSKVTKATKKNKAKKMKVSLKKVSGSAGYKIQVSTTKKFKKVLVEKTVKKTAVTVSSKKIKGKKTLFVRVKNTQKYNGKLFSSKWSGATKVKVK